MGLYLPTSTMTERPSQTSSCLSALTARRSSLARRRNGCISCTVSRSPLRRPVTRKLSRRCSELPPPAAADDRSTCSVCSSDEQSQSAPFSMYNGDRRSCNTTPSHRPQTPPPVLPPGKLLSAPEKYIVPCVCYSLQLVLLRTVYSQAKGCVCTALQLGGDVEHPWLMSKYDVIHKTGST